MDHFDFAFIVREEPGAEAMFQWWYDQSVKATSQVEGYTRTNLCTLLSYDDKFVFT